MLVVKIELHSAVTKKVTEIGRMIIANDGKGKPGKYHYLVDLLRRGSINKAQRSGKVENYNSDAYTVWLLVAKALASVGIIGKGADVPPINDDPQNDKSIWYGGGLDKG